MPDCFRSYKYPRRQTNIQNIMFQLRTLSQDMNNILECCIMCLESGQLGHLGTFVAPEGNWDKSNTQFVFQIHCLRHCFNIVVTTFEQKKYWKEISLCSKNNQRWPLCRSPATLTKIAMTDSDDTGYTGVYDGYGDNDNGYNSFYDGADRLLSVIHISPKANKYWKHYVSASHIVSRCKQHS